MLSALLTYRKHMADGIARIGAGQCNSCDEPFERGEMIGWVDDIDGPVCELCWREEVAA
jgi:hypothetical protein